MQNKQVLDRSFSETVDKLIVALTNLLDRNVPLSKASPGWHTFLLVAMHSTKTIYAAIKYLAADSPQDPDRKVEYGIVISPLNRVLSDLLFNIILLYLYDSDQSHEACGFTEHAGGKQEGLNIFRHVRGTIRSR